ncbi:hypothetical protein ON010_g9632 [Phytophthora cinnamomi]|nr:hypothetical protein ON010_g9632 [Phytophthora cinnamomi]
MYHLDNDVVVVVQIADRVRLVAVSRLQSNVRQPLPKTTPTMSHTALTSSSSPIKNQADHLEALQRAKVVELRDLVASEVHVPQLGELDRPRQALQPSQATTTTPNQP